MNAVFADTFYFLGLLNRADESHSRCAAYAREYRGAVVTSAYVLVEVADGLAMPQHRVQTARFIQALQTHARVRIVPASQTLLGRGLEFYAARPDKEWSLTDCISFLVMADETMREALTGDRHFQQAGFVALLC
jgi:uncharacterized protein